MVGALAMLTKELRFTRAGRPVRFVYHVMDLYPDAAVASGYISENLRTDRAMRRLTGRTLETADAVIALGRDMKDRILERYAHHVRPERIHVISPWADREQLFPIEKSQNDLARTLELDETFNIVYSGNLGVAHDLDTMTAAIEAMRHDPDIRWVFIGGGNRFEVLKHRASEAKWANVTILPFAERDKLNASLNLADVHLVSQLPAFTGVVVPSKLFGIMAVGKPAVMIGPAGAECSRIIAEHACGEVVANGDANALVAALRKLKDDPSRRAAMGSAGRSAFERAYDRNVTCAQIERLLCDVVNADR
jgi:glycosyltransferase involved in cell wall biosynthesis